MPKTIDRSVLQNLQLQSEQTLSFVRSHVLGIDYGEKFSGLAWLKEGVIFPIKVVPTQELAFNILKISAEKSIEHLVFGLPISGDNSENHICAKIRKFSDQFKSNFIVDFVNERASTQNVLTNNTGRKDDLAAAQILEFWGQQKTKK